METSTLYSSFIGKFFSFYPTYKEWKPFIILSTIVDIGLFILPIRNGNVQSAENTRCRYKLFILPIRNGNQVKTCYVKS